METSIVDPRKRFYIPAIKKHVDKKEWRPHIPLIIDRSPCPKGVRIIGRWCSTPYIEAKDTLESVTIWLSLIPCIRFCYTISGGIPS